MYARQSSQLATPQGSRVLAAIMAVIVMFAAIALAIGVRTFVTQGAADAAPAVSQAYDSPALRDGNAFAPVARPQYDSPALRGGSTSTAVAPKAISFETSDALRKEHLGIAPATIGTRGVVSGRDRIEIHRLEHLVKPAAVSLDTWDALRKEHLPGAVIVVDTGEQLSGAPTFVNTRGALVDRQDALEGLHPGGGGR